MATQISRIATNPLASSQGNQSLFLQHQSQFQHKPDITIHHCCAQPSIQTAQKSQLLRLSLSDPHFLLNSFYPPAGVIASGACALCPLILKPNCKSPTPPSLDVNMNPKISDFGLAKIFGVDQNQGNTRRIVGTYGYMAPEYAMEGLYSVKSDVFSFGVLLLEILTGRKNFLGYHATTSVPTLLNYAWELWNEGKVLELMDPSLKDSCSPNEFLRYIHIGLLCVQEDANNRSPMSSVVLMLKSESIGLSKPERPAFYTGRKYINDHDNTLGALFSCSVNGLTIFYDVPR